MKMKCVIASYLHGDVVKVGKTVEIDDAEAATSRIRRSFVAVEGEASASARAAAAGPAPAKSGPAVVAGLTRDQAVAKLRQAGARFSGNITNEKLVALYETTFANAAEATEK